MIPRAHLTHWRHRAPWPSDAQVEQDLVLSRALVELFGEPRIAETLAFRGGTALHKLVLEKPGRYSEDIDLVQRGSGGIGATFDAIRERLRPWLGEARWKQSEGRATLVYRFETTSLPLQRMRVKIEINTREHFSALPHRSVPFEVESPWFAGRAEVTTFTVEELLGTKLRALYQRRKGRDLFDLEKALTELKVDDGQVVECFERYMEHGGTGVTRAEFEDNLERKLSDSGFLGDLLPLIAEPERHDARRAAEVVRARLISRLGGGPRTRRDGH